MWHDILNEMDSALADPGMAVPIGMQGDGARFNVYRNNIAVGLADALSETFPVVRKLVGDDFFAAMAQLYIRENRPASPVLFEYGQSFAAFIDAFEPAREIPFLGDVARLERLWLDAYHAADVSPLGIEALQDVPQDRLDDLRVRLHPSIGLIESVFPVISIWCAHQEAVAPDLSRIDWLPEQGVIVRPHMNVEVHALDAPTLWFADGLQAGCTLGRLCADLADITAPDPSRHLAALFNMGAVIALDHSPRHGGSSHHGHRSSD